MVGANLCRSLDEATLERHPKGLTAVSVRGQRYICTVECGIFIPN